MPTDEGLPRNNQSSKIAFPDSIFQRLNNIKAKYLTLNNGFSNTTHRPLSPAVKHEQVSNFIALPSVR